MNSPKKLTNEQIQQIRHLYVDLKYSSEMVMAKLGFTPTTVRRYMKQLGVMRNLSASRKLAVQLGRLKLGSKPGAESISWKGGRHFNNRGYILLYLQKDNPFYCMSDRDHYVAEHRLVIAQLLNKPLTSDDFVHHLNGIKTDNRIANLALVTRNNHPSKTLMKLLQKRIRDLEAQLSQQKLC